MQIFTGFSSGDLHFSTLPTPNAFYSLPLYSQTIHHHCKQSVVILKASLILSLHLEMYMYCTALTCFSASPNFLTKYHIASYYTIYFLKLNQAYHSVCWIIRDNIKDICHCGHKHVCKVPALVNVCSPTGQWWKCS